MDPQPQPRTPCRRRLLQLSLPDVRGAPRAAAELGDQRSPAEIMAQAAGARIHGIRVGDLDAWQRSSSQTQETLMRAGAARLVVPRR